MAWAERAAPDLPDLIVFDGDCVLCSHWARFVHERDPDGRFRFVAIQSEFGQALAVRFGVDADTPQSNVVILGGVARFKSDAAIAILSALPGWKWVGAARFAPKPLRHWLYDVIARNRYRWFGRRERCWAGDPSLKARILERAP